MLIDWSHEQDMRPLVRLQGALVGRSLEHGRVLVRERKQNRQYHCRNVNPLTLDADICW
jgi:hypothetical protein